MFRLPSFLPSAIVPILVLAIAQVHAADLEYGELRQTTEREWIAERFRPETEQQESEQRAALPEARAALAPQAEPRNLVNGVTLMDADRDVPLQPLADGDILLLQQLASGRLNVRVDAEPSVSRIVFSLNEHKRYREETAKPYSLAGDRSGDYQPWTPRPGANHLVITPYEGGSSGKPIEIRFTVEGEPPQGKTPEAEVRPAVQSAALDTQAPEAQPPPEAALERVALKTSAPEIEPEQPLVIVEKPADPHKAVPAPEVIQEKAAGEAKIAEAPAVEGFEPKDEEDKPAGRCVGFVNRDTGELTVACNHSKPEAVHAKVMQMNPDASESKVCDFMNATSPIITTCPMSLTTVGALHRGRLFVDVRPAGSAEPLTLRIELE